MDNKLIQSEKADSSIFSIPDGKVIFVKVQFLNALLPITFTGYSLEPKDITSGTMPSKAFV